MNRIGTSVCLFLAGAAVGSVGAVLTAPQSGRKTRQLLHRQLEEGQEQFSGIAASLRETGNELWCRGERAFKEAERIFA